MKFKIALIPFFVVCLSAFSQDITFSGEANLQGYYAVDEELPFWFRSNQRGRISEETNVAGWLTGKMTYQFGANSILEIGGGILYSDGFTDEVAIDELYVQYSNTWLQANIGRKQREELYNGLSATNENMIWSLNARPMPGIRLKTIKPIFFDQNKRFGFDATWEEYLMGKDRFVENARLHHKSLHLVYRSKTGWEFKAGLQHFAQWAGTSPEFGEQPDSFNDYFKIVTGRGGGEGARQEDVENALGNHLGSWELYVSKKTENYSAKFIFNNIFEDGSGSRFANFPDGRYGIFLENLKQDSWFESFIYELYYTKHQSHDVNRWGADNYFGHRLMYQSGWAYKDQILGTPFFLYDGDRDRVINNKFLAHHIGLSGFYPFFSHNYPFKVLMSYAQNEGTYDRDLALNPDRVAEDILYFSAEGQLLQKPFQLNLKLGTDINSYSGNNFGIGLHILKAF